MLYINSFCSMYSVCICSWWWDVHTCIYFVSSVVFVDFLIKSSSQKKLVIAEGLHNLLLTLMAAETCQTCFVKLESESESP